MPITSNPIIDLTERDVVLFYLTGGSAIFGCVGDPNGAVTANKQSLAISDNGSAYLKTTDNSNTGWTVIGGGGGLGTVTSVAMTLPSVLFTTPPAGSPITTAGTLALALATQTANRVFAGPASGIAATPTFRALTSADLSLAAPPPAGGIPYNDGANAFTAETGFLFDAATGTLQIGVAAARSGRMQLRSLVSGSTTFTVDTPSSAHVITMPNALPLTNDLLRASAVAGSNITWGYVAPSALGFPTINATDGVIPYRSSSSAFSDSPITRNSSTQITVANQIFAGSDGSAAAVNFGRSTSQNTGIYFPGTNQVGIVANGIGTLTVSSSSLAVVSTAPIIWNADTSVQRLGVGVLRVGNGSTGAGQLVVGSSTAATTNQFLVDSQSTTRIAGFFSMPGSSSVATIKAETSAVQSFAFFPTGKLQGGCNIPTSNQQFSAIGNLKSDVSELGNVGTGQDNLLSFAVPAASIANTGDTVEFKTTFVFANNANNKEVEILFGGVSIFLVSDLFGAAGQSQAEVTVRIKRTGATTAKVIATWISSDTLLRADCQYTNAAAITWANANTFQVQGEATATDDIVNKELESNVIIAQTS